MFLRRKMFCQGGKEFFEVEYVLSGKIMFCQEENVFEGRNVLRWKMFCFLGASQAVGCC